MRKVVSVVLTLSLLAPSLSLAHSGGTDSNGCHAGSQPYHCHSAKSPELNWEAMAVGLLLLWGINALTKDKSETQRSFNEGNGSPTPRLNLLPQVDFDESFSPSLLLEYGIDF